MGTRSVIGVKHGDKVKAVYCHWDGYLEHNGFILQNFYDSVKANHLVSLGDLSSLGAEVGEKHDFGAPADYLDVENAIVSVSKQCTFYGRDRGEDNVAWKVMHSDKEMFDYFSDCEYYYVMDNGIWYVSRYKRSWELLSVALEQCKETV
jgi:hypothetical protein